MRHVTIVGFALTFCTLVPTVAVAQAPWTVTLTPTLNPLPVGLCGAVQLTLLDPVSHDVPRNPQGFRVTMADFDMTVVGSGAAGRQIDASHYEVCACQGGATGGSATVIASYPAQALAVASRVPNVSFQNSAMFTLGAAKGPVNPQACVTAATGPAAPGAPSGSSPPARSGPPSVPAGPLAPVAIGTTAPRPAVPAGTAIGSAPAPASPGSPGMVNPSGLTALQVGPGEVRISWQPVAGVQSYAVTGPGLPPSGWAFSLAIGTSAVTQSVSLGMHEWSVGSLFITGGGGFPSATPEADFGRVSLEVRPWTVTPATAVNPTAFRANQLGPGEVQLSWTPVSGVAYYALFGPGLAQGGVKVPGTTAFTATNVPAGNQEWSVASFYEPGPVSTAASAFSRVSLNVTAPLPAPPPPPAPAPAATSGRYLVTVTGLRAYQVSQDDPLSRDGVGDEVYTAAVVRRYDRNTGQLRDFSSRKTTPYGDVNMFGTQRIQAGTFSATGGIRDGDPVPDGPLVAVRTLPAQDATFPWRLWEGTLTDGIDAVIITPSIWEQDGGTSFFAQWEQQQLTLNQSLFSRQGVQDQITQKTFGSLVSGVSGVNGNMALGIQARNFTDLALLSFGVPLANLLSTSADRAIGIVGNGSGPDQTMLPIHTVVLTREIIEAALSRPALGAIPSPLDTFPPPPPIARIGMTAPKPGVLVVHLQDGVLPGMLGPTRPAVYQMFIQVERVP